MSLSDLPLLPVIRPSGPHLSMDRRTVYSFTGEPLAEVCETPPLLLQVIAREVRATSAQMPAAERAACIARAGRLLAAATLDGLDPAAFVRLHVQATGLPLAASAAALEQLGSFMERIEEALARQIPGGDWAALDTGRVCDYAWVPRGDVMGLIAPNNHPQVHFTWVLALALGWSVLVRPGSDDVFTPYRIYAALREAGFPVERIAVVPGPHTLVSHLIDAADRTVLYGGQEAVERFGSDPRVKVHGPGRSMMLVDLTGPVHIDAAAACVVESVLHDGGVKCTNASALVIRGGGSPDIPGNRAHALLERIAQRLAQVVPRHPLDPQAQLAAFKDPGVAQACSAAVQAGLAPGDTVLAGRFRPVTTADGTFLPPALVRCAGPESPLFRRELPFPFLTAVALPAGADPLPLLQDALAVTLITCDRDLVQRCLRAAGTRKVFHGLIPTWRSAPGGPHEGLLSRFLFEEKAFWAE